MSQRTRRERLAPVLVILIGLALSGAVRRSQAVPSSDPVPAEEYAVYAAAMQQVVGGISFLVVDTTSMPNKPSEIPEALSFPLEDAPRLTSDMVDDFKTKNSGPHTLAEDFPTLVTVTLMTEVEHRAMFAGCSGGDNCGWAVFYKKYPAAPGITTLSRVGFDATHDFALLYLSNVRDYEAGTGLYLLLAKREGRWKVISRSRSWIS